MTQTIATEIKPAAAVIYVDPSMASRWLGKNLKNRNMTASTVAQYARDMAAGSWQFTGEAIKFDIAGNLIDGQHRLMAIMQSEVTLPMLVVRNLPPESQGVMDTGRKRSAADALNLDGVKNHTLIAAIARLGIQIESADRSNQPVSNAEIKAWVEDNDDVHSVASTVSGVKKYIDLTPAPIGYAWLLLHRSNPTKCAEFFDALVNNSTDGKGDPRNTLLRRAAAAQKAREHLSRETQVQFIVRAWNAWVSGKELHVLKVRSSDAKGGSTRVSIPAVRRAA